MIILSKEEVKLMQGRQGGGIDMRHSRPDRGTERVDYVYHKLNMVSEYWGVEKDEQEIVRKYFLLFYTNYLRFTNLPQVCIWT